MPDLRYDATRQTIGTLLSTTSPKIEVPEWQRSYAWGSDEVGAFWDDLLAFDSSYPGDNIKNEEYFLGSAVLVTGGTTNLLLDGQQRLATATILLSVLRDFRVEYKADSATRLQNKYIADQDDATGLTTPVLTLNVYDREYFRGEVQTERNEKNSPPKATLKSHGLIKKARDFFKQKVAEQWQSAGGGELGFKRNLRLSDVLCNHMSLVVVHSSDEDNAAAVFETLNDRGIGLSTPDLLRNHLLRKAVGPEAKRRIVSAWQEILGIADEASVDDFLRHFWVSKRGDVKSRKLYREIKGVITSESIDPVEFSLELAVAAPIYRDLSRGRDEDAELQRLLQGIQLLGAKVLLPALLSCKAISDEQSSKTEIRQFASALTALFVRHSVIGGKDSSSLESKIYSVAAELRSEKSFEKAIQELQEFSPSAEEFTERFSRASVRRIATVRYLLREIEHAKRATQEVAVELADRVHVEHIYPQTPRDGERWDSHARVINRLGNLTLLGRKLNSSIKNADFSTKKEQGYDGSEILLTRELLNLDRWSPEQIDVRQKDLSRNVASIWSFPNEEIGTVGGGLSSADNGNEMSERDQVLDELPEVPE